LQHKFPIKYVTIFQATNRPMQYILTSHVETETDRRLERLDGIVWRSVPPRYMALEGQGSLTVACIADFESFSSNFIDELAL
jgi:hypothetical protein